MEHPFGATPGDPDTPEVQEVQEVQDLANNIFEPTVIEDPVIEDWFIAPVQTWDDVEAPTLMIDQDPYQPPIDLDLAIEEPIPYDPTDDWL